MRPSAFGVVVTALLLNFYGTSTTLEAQQAPAPLPDVLSGTWNGIVGDGVQDDPLTLTLTQKDRLLTGTVADDGDGFVVPVEGVVTLQTDQAAYANVYVTIDTGERCSPSTLTSVVKVDLVLGKMVGTVSGIDAGCFPVNQRLSLVKSNVQMAIDGPSPGNVNGAFVVAGWALDRAATTGSGIDAIHLYAYPASGASPIFLGTATLGVSRPDVAGIFGAGFLQSGYGVLVNSLPAGTYDIAVFPRSTVTQLFAAARVVRVTVK